MYIGKVVGNVVSTIKISHLDGRKLLLVNQLDLKGNETDDYDIAVDVVQAGPGDTVLSLTRNGARSAIWIRAPSAVIVGVVDQVALEPAPGWLSRSVSQLACERDGAASKRGFVRLG
jgi:microcompartment protein CcmK/EutM